MPLPFPAGIPSGWLIGHCELARHLLIDNIGHYTYCASTRRAGLSFVLQFFADEAVSVIGIGTTRLERHVLFGGGLQS